MNKNDDILFSNQTTTVCSRRRNRSTTTNNDEFENNFLSKRQKQQQLEQQQQLIIQKNTTPFKEVYNSKELVPFLNNFTNKFKYIYPLPYYIEKSISELRHITDKDINVLEFALVSIPDGVSAKVNETIIKRHNTPFRLYVYSNRQLTPLQLSVIIDQYKVIYPYPLFQLETPCTNLINDTKQFNLLNNLPNIDPSIPIIPKHNFYALNDSQFSMDNYQRVRFNKRIFNDNDPFLLTPFDVTIDSEFVNYKYIQHRYEPTNIFYNQYSGDVFRLVLPKHRALTVYIMPENFIQTDLKVGYFHLNDNLIIRVYSQHILSSYSNLINNSWMKKYASAVAEAADNVNAQQQQQQQQHEHAEEFVSVISVHNEFIMRRIYNFFNHMNIINISINSNDQVIGYDDTLTFVVGNISNISL